MYERLKILLTGGTGFLGHALLYGLRNEKYSVIAIKRKNSSLSRIENITQNILFYDIDSSSLIELFQQHPDINIIVHLATHYGRKGESFSEIFHANVTFPLELLKIGLCSGVEYFINTDTFFPSHINDYAYTKKAFLEAARSLCFKNGAKMINLCLGHLYGPIDSLSKFIPQMIVKLLKNVSEINLTKGEQLRDFIYVDDVVAAYCLILKKIKELSDSYIQFSVGSGKVTSIFECMNMMKTLTNSSSYLAFGSLEYSSSEIMHSLADNKALQALGWQPQYLLQEGLTKTIEFYKENMNRPLA